MNYSVVDILKIILCFILPPLAVFLDRGCDCTFFLNVILTILCIIPGVIHALIVICS
ncbi:UPF0057-domain-containing protein [Anaeromyces robustus]|uniref:UPF0057-domain-containing protein n=1 Tax=Anaeromyces robustus TaxID=1754192 RepID=A0A1Y1WT60_9FUNG|nr:UPF0057-domain-containing protein [Anaeromyces robustus]|eukprot:ORX76632.1 UPF0057-domain-containing protein [Anaeromyces robustus]